ncbi:hypothetical protein ACTFIY_010771 [Dictyostelium cf. discoideum]
MSTKECYFCDQIVELFEFHCHSLKCIIKASHKYSVDIETVINETLIEVNVDYKLLKQRINKKQKSDHLFENDFSPSNWLLSFSVSLQSSSFTFFLHQPSSFFLFRQSLLCFFNFN